MVLTNPNRRLLIYCLPIDDLLLIIDHLLMIGRLHLVDGADQPEQERARKCPGSVQEVSRKCLGSGQERDPRAAA